MFLMGTFLYFKKVLDRDILKWYSVVVVENKVEYPLSPEHQHSCDSWFYIQGIGNIPVV